ncbi:MAG: hypothetical protein S4CHLAM20_14110 [Chlamydiia bacterium]|nr:hypothetical protein [Chlamydiia bacterium]
MKKVFFSLIVSLSLFATNLQISKIFKDLNLYLFENKYLIRSSGLLPHCSRGRSVDVNMDYFYEMNKWVINWHIFQFDEIIELNYTLHPIGLLDSKKLSFEEFQAFVSKNASSKKLKSYRSIFFNRNPFKRDKTSDFKDFEKTSEIADLNWVVEKFKGFDKRLKHNIQLIYGINGREEPIGIIAEAIVGLTTVTTFVELEIKEEA